MSKVRVQNSIIDGTVLLPPSKSAAHRALICSFLAGGGEVSPLIESKDMLATVSAIRALENGENTINCIESGSTLRFMIPIAAALGRAVTFVGEGKLPERPIGEYLRLLPEHNVECRTDGGLPLSIEGQLVGGRFEIAGDISSQYITGLLLALPLLDDDSEIVLTTELESKPYVNMTIKVMADYGVEVAQTENGYFIKGHQKYIPRDYSVEGDWSQAAFYAVAGALFGRVEMTGVYFNSTQGDKQIADIIERFGARVERGENSLTVYKSNLKGIEIDAADIPDMVPALAVLGAYADGTTVIKGAQRLRLKESDRIESVTYNLKKSGADITPTPDGMIIKHSTLKGAELKGFNDHRIVMAMTVAATGAQGESIIDDAQSINKSYPAFFDDYNKLGGKANVICDR
ncbi:3-phosphoshikimate 1-carboxyvinyltransferase [uncultured Eubacterium sp.]|uniref:3-phosphoshikimate 1-carboxyvinyltransferase n=1 Tax=uncultured Eubacterium sp. TaxID=165185 RepID=UPI0015B093C7|nr:3-phosphoshikimate 1-carboxyvinyltransferase [uncultured Eubacterium sp.]